MRVEQVVTLPPNTGVGFNQLTYQIQVPTVACSAQQISNQKHFIVNTLIQLLHLENTSWGRGVALGLRPSASPWSIPHLLC